LLGIASAVFLGSESCRTHEHYLPVYIYIYIEREREGERERERERESERKETFSGCSERHYIEGGVQENNIFGLEGSQAVPASPSDRDKAYDQN
jgi:hypothetical protein